MKNTLYLSLLFLLIACEQRPKNVDSSPSINDPIESVREEISDSPNSKIDKVKVYIENTLSMYGYLPDKKLKNTGFRNAVNELLIVSKDAYAEENVNLYLINNETTTEISARDNLDQIDVNSLKSTYPKGRGSSDFDRLFDKILQERKQDEVVVFVADFIYSPGNADISSGLDRLRQNVTKAFSKTKISENLSINILHLDSDFDGPYYYNIDNEAVNGINNRPYYIFIIGEEKDVNDFSNRVVPTLQKYNLENEYFLSSSETEITNYSALPFTLNLGQFEARTAAPITTLTVKNALKHSNLQLAIAANLSDVPASSDYLSDINNYRLNDNRIEIVDIGKIQGGNRVQLINGEEVAIKSGDISKATNASHVFLVSFPNTYNGSIELTLNKEIPNWVDEVSIPKGEDDRDIKRNIKKQSQTFGFKSLVEGIFDAQKNQTSQNRYFHLTIDINQEKSTSGGAIIGWLFGITIILIIIFIIIKNKQRK